MSIIVHPIRLKSTNGQPRPHSPFERTCKTCHASFLGLAPGKTGERGIWTDWKWYCSTECAEKA
jgi:cytochrome c5